MRVQLLAPVLASLLAACSGVAEAPRLAMAEPKVAALCQATTFQLPGSTQTYAVAKADGTLTTEYYEYVGRDLDNIDLLLDCGLVKTADPGLKLLRGHVLVALAGKYAEFNMTGRVGPSVTLGYDSYTGMDEDASAILTHLYNSELGMASAKAQLTDATTLPTPSPQADRMTQRLLPMVVLAIKSEAPSAQRTKSLIGTLLGAFSGDASQLRAGGQILAGAVGKVMVMHSVGTAYFKDARESLHMVQACASSEGTAETCDIFKTTASPQSLKVIQMAGGDSAKLQSLVWTQWEGKLMEACTTLAHVAGTPPRCIPSAAEAAKGFGT